MKRLVLLLSLVSVGASAQALRFQLPSDLTATSYTYGSGMCGQSLTLGWRNVGTIALHWPGNPLEIWATESTSCGNEPGTADVVLAEVQNLLVSSVRQGEFTIEINELPGHATVGSDGGVSQVNCPYPTPTTKKHTICGSVQYTFQNTISSSSQYAKTTPFTLIYDTEPPPAPAIEDAEGYDGAITVTFSATGDASIVQLEVMGPEDTEFRRAGEVLVSSTSIVQGAGFANGVEYQVRVRAIDDAGNPSDPSAARGVTPSRTIGFYDYWNENGGPLEGGCASAPMLLPLLALGFALRRKKR